jgi:CDP-diacylglycerol--glycerol-3-phosphate 3-phosphatidyltransferase
VTGAFLFLVPIAGSGVAAWMVVVIVARESLIDGIRGFAEARGIAFPASFWGKTKMVSQSACVTAILLTLANFRGSAVWETLSTALLVWAIFVTVFSGALYLVHARKLLGRGAGGEKLSPAPAPAGVHGGGG